MDLRTKRTICLLIGIASILTIVGTISYAYFTAMSEMTPVESVINTATVRATFADYGDEVGGTLGFGESLTKKFTIENTGTAEAHVKMYWKELINTYTEQSLTYTLSYSETENGTYTEVVGKTNVPQSETASREILANSLTIPVTKTYYYNLEITLNYLDDVNQDADLKATFNSKFGIEDIKYREPMTVADLIAKANSKTIVKEGTEQERLYADGDKKEMFVFDHPTATQTTGWNDEERRDYRYIGNEPNNYIDFNNETWRIIGVFTVEVEKEDESLEKQQLIKIIRDASIGDLKWNSSNVNEWSTSSLKTMLNGDYLNKGSSFTYESQTIEGLDETAQGQVANVRWYLGGSSTYENLKGPDYYAFERGTTTCVTTGYCSGQTRETVTTGKVGLMYPSDYVYTYDKGVDTTCFNDGYNCCTNQGGTPSNGWLFKSGTNQWTLSPNATYSDNAFYSNSTGYVLGSYYVGLTSSVRPVVYLSSDAQIVDGDGSSGNHYKLGV